MTPRLALAALLALAAPASAQDGAWFAGDPADGVEGIRLEAAYDALAGREPAREVIVAVIDSGVDTDHPDLAPVLWTNPGEIAGNGLDDDGNGYADDLHGWSFLGGPGGTVDKDTYELTRLVAACRAEAPYPATDCPAVEAELAAERAQLTGQLLQVEPLYAQVAQADSLLRARFPAYDGDAAALDVGMDATAGRAKGLLSAFAAQGFGLDDLQGFVTYLRDGLAYGYNPEFDPRPAVGDDYANPAQRDYGVPDVDGPDANHGTGVAGLVAAVRGNGLGIDGIAPNTESATWVRIMALRAVPGGDERDKDVANAIRYAADNGAHIVNMSFGKAYSPQKAAVDDAVRYALERGVLFVHAAGNDAADIDAVPSYPSARFADGRAAGAWLEVGASGETASALAAEFSNVGATRVDLFAPGAQVGTLAKSGLTTVTDGTSFAAPIVSGVAALLMAYVPELTAGEVRELLVASARDRAELMVPAPGTGAPVRFGDLSATGGLVDAAAAVELALARAGG